MKNLYVADAFEASKTKLNPYRFTFNNSRKHMAMYQSKRLTTILAILSVVCLSHAQKDFTFNHGGANQSGYSTIIQYENVRGKLIVPVEFNGKRYRFMVDTGALTMISSGLHNELNSTVLKRIPVTDANQQEDSLLLVSLNQITLGDIQFMEIPAIVAKENIIFDCYRIDGLIGSNLLRNSIVQIDYAASTLVLTDDATKLKLNHRQSSDLFLDTQSGPYFWINLQNKGKGKQQVLLDTGMDGFYDLSLGHYAQLEKHNLFLVKAKARGSTVLGMFGKSTDTTHYRLELPSLTLNKTSFTSVTLQTALGSSSRIGCQLLEYGIVTIDYKNRKFNFSPYTAGPINMAVKEYPVDFFPSERKLLIGFVWDDALTGRISQGDQVLAINDKNVDYITVCELMEESQTLQDLNKLTLRTRNMMGEVIETVIEKK